MSDYEQAVFISYAWGEDTHEREAIVNQLDKSLKKRGLNIIRDRRDLDYKGSIRNFMERIGEGDCVIVVISDKYLRSKNCMYELVVIAENKQFSDRIFPIILEDARIYDPGDRIDYIAYWENKKAELNEKLNKLRDKSHTFGILGELKDYDRFHDEIDGLTSLLKDMNSLTPNIHRDADFNDIYNAIVKRMSESTRTRKIEDMNANVRVKGTEEKESSEQPRTISGTTTPIDEPRTIYLSKLKELETHQSSLRMYVEGYLRLSKRRDECDAAKSKILEKGINKIEEGESLDWNDLGEISSSLSSASMDEVLPSALMFSDLKTKAGKLIEEMKELERLDKMFQTISPTKVEEIGRTLNEALPHLNKSIPLIKSLMDSCGDSIRTEIGHIESLINTIVGTKFGQELPKATEVRVRAESGLISSAGMETRQALPVQR